jgi:hypothetical protein
MMGSVVQHVTTLAKAFQFSQPIVRGIAVQMRRGKDHACDAKTGGLTQVRPARGPATPISLRPCLLIKPTPFRIRR